MGTTITFRRGDNDPTSGSGLTLSEPAFNTTLKTFHIGLGHGITAAWVGAPISGLSADIAAGITYKIPSAAAVNNYIGGLCYGNTGATTITQYVQSFNGLTGAVGGVCAAQANTFTALQSFANGISASGITVNGNMSVTGNFTVSGGVTFTASETVLIEDNIIILNSNVTGSPSENAGIEIKRGTSANVQLLWNESSDRWTFTNDGSTYYDLPTSVVTSFNGLTGAVNGVTVGGANTFTALNTFNAGISSAGGTFSALTRFTAGISAAGGITFANDISVNGIRTGRGGGNVSSNTAVGASALVTNTTGSSNSAMGLGALGNNTTGGLNTAVGAGALAGNSSGNNNSAVGEQTLYNNTTGSFNTAVGGIALNYNTTGSSNVAIGWGAGTFYADDQELFDPENSIYIGAGAQGFSNSDYNTIVIGSSAIADGANTTVIGNSSTTSTRVFGTLSTNGGISAAGGTFSALTRFTAGISAAGATFSGTVTAPTPAVGTNNTQVATTAFVQSEIMADAVTAFNGRTGSVQGVSSAAAGTGIFVNAATGAVTISNTGVLSFNGITGAVQGVSAAVAGSFITVSSATGSVTITNTGVQSFNGNTGAVQGVSAAVAGSFITVSAATGSVTITNTGVQSFNGLTGAVTGASLGANTFTALNSFNAGVSATGLTVGGAEGIQITRRLPFNSLIGEVNFVKSLGSELRVSNISGSQIIFQGRTASIFSPNNSLTIDKGATEGSEPTGDYAAEVRFVTKTGLIKGSATLVPVSGYTTDRTINLPNASGTLALTSQLMGAVNGSTAAVTTYAGTTGNIQFRYGSGVTANNTFTLSRGDEWIGEETEWFTISGYTYSGGLGVAVGNVESKGIRINRSYGQLELDIGGAVGIEALGVYNDGIETYGSSLYLTTPNTLYGADIIIAPKGVASCSFSDTGAYVGVTFTALGATFGGTITGATATFSRLTTHSAGISASGGMTLAGSFQGSTATFSGLGSFSAGISAAGATFSGTVTAPTPAVGTNNTQVATTAFVQSEIVADAVTGFNGRTGAVQGVSSAAAGTGIFLNAATGAVTITNTGVLSFNGVTGAVQGVSAAVAGSFITVSSATGAVTITNTGVQSFNGLTGAVTGVTVGGANTFTALNSFNAGISSNGATLSGTVTAPTPAVGTNNTQVATTAFVQSEIVADAVTTFNGRTGAVQGVSAAVAGTGISVSGSTGAVTITNTGVQSFNGRTGAVQGVSSAAAGTGISVSGSTGAVTITNIGVQSFNGLTGAVTGVTVGGANTFTALQTFSAGISAAGATLSSNTNIPAGSTLTVNGNFVANGNVNLGDATSDSITVAGLLTANAGISAAGGTFSALTRFTAGISASGGMTLAGSFQGSTATFSGLGSFSAGLSAAGTTAATFGGTVNMGFNTLFQPTLRYYNEVVAYPTISGGGLTLDISSAQVFGVTLNAGVNTLSITNTPATANRSIGFTLILTADGTARGITWGAAVKWANNDPPTLTSTNGKRDILSFVSPDGGTNWYAFIAGLNF